MSTPVPPPIQTPPMSSAGGGFPTVTISNPPAAVAALPAGSTLQATVSAVQAGNQLQLATALGTLLGTVNVSLKADSALTLLTLARPPSAQSVALQIVEVAGRPIAPATATGAQNSPGGLSPGRAGQPAATAGTPPTATVPATVTLSVGQTIAAVLVQPVTSATGPQGTLPQPPDTTSQTSNQSAPTANPTSATRTPTAPNPSGDRPAAPTGMPAPPTGTPATGPAAGSLVPGARLSLGIVSVIPTPAQSSSPMPAPLPSVGGTFTGLVIGSTPSGQPLVHTPVGQVSLEQAPPMAKGAEIVFRLEADPANPVTSARLGDEANRTQFIRGHGWPALDELSAALNERAPGLGDRLAHLITPQADAKLGTTLLFLLSALKGGDLKSWLGESGMRELSRLRPDTMRRLGDDVRMLATTVDDADSRPVRSGDWRTFPLPLFGEGMEQSRLLVRRDRSDEEVAEQKPPKETRFVVDLTLTSIGRLQLDGLIDPGTRRFDMLVRSTSKLPAKFRGDILQIFATANETIGMTGGLAFRASPDALIEAADATDKASRDGGIVV